MILIMGGTTEARKLFFRLQELGVSSVISVISDYGSNLMNAAPSQVHLGRLGSNELTSLIKAKKYNILIDATHPFAVEASENAMKAAHAAGIAYIRLERAKEDIPSSKKVKLIKSLDELTIYLEKDKMLFSAIGSNNLEILISLVKKKKARLAVRVLPLLSVLEKCFEMDLKPDDIAAIKGPFSRELNREMYKSFGADIIVTKESGKEGGQSSNIQAALDLGLEVAVWKRPDLEYPTVLNDIESTIAYLLNKEN